MIQSVIEKSMKEHKCFNDDTFFFYNDENRNVLLMEVISKHDNIFCVNKTIKMKMCKCKAH